MRLAYGSTRIVLLTAATAYKVGRIRPFRAFGRVLFKLPFSRRAREHYLRKYGPGYRRAFAYDLWAGVYANRAEYAYSQQYPGDARVMLTTGCYLAGLVITQPRGRALPKSAPWSMGLLEYLPEDLHALELFKPFQYCLYPLAGRVVLIDYGKPQTIISLIETELFRAVA